MVVAGRVDRRFPFGHRMHLFADRRTFRFRLDFSRGRLAGVDRHRVFRLCRRLGSFDCGGGTLPQKTQRSVKA